MKKMLERLPATWQERIEQDLLSETCSEAESNVIYNWRWWNVNLFDLYFNLRRKNKWLRIINILNLILTI